MPVPLQALGQINLVLHWTYGVGNEPAATTDDQALNGVLLNGNVAIDMFIDSDQTNAQDSNKAKYEVMVWFADFGAAAQPIGQENGVVATHNLDGTTLFVTPQIPMDFVSVFNLLTYHSPSNLYSGQNGLGQNVLTWLASATTERFNGDVAPLLSQLLTSNLADAPGSSDYLGYWGLGSEAFSANSNVTFSVPLLSVDIQTQ